MTNLVRNAELLHPGNFPVLQAVWFGRVEVCRAVVSLLDVQRTVGCRQLEIQTHRITRDVQFTAALTWSFLPVSVVIRLCRRLRLFLLRALLLFYLTAVSSWLVCSRPPSFFLCGWTGDLAVARSCIQVPGLGLYDRGLWGDSIGAALSGQSAALSGQSAVARFVWGPETEPLARFWTVAPVKLGEAGFPGLRRYQSSSPQGAVPEICSNTKQRNCSSVSLLFPDREVPMKVMGKQEF